jgi:hypothetical protein
MADLVPAHSAVDPFMLETGYHKIMLPRSNKLVNSLVHPLSSRHLTDVSQCTNDLFWHGPHRPKSAGAGQV